MKKFLMLTLAAATMGSAFAMPTDGEHSYSMQGPATHVRVINRNRNIPAPSSWTPPERIPSKPVAYVKRDQPKRLGGGFTSPSFSNPSFSNPTFSSPTFSNPTASSPTFSAPNFSNPSFSSPNFQAPGNSGAPSFSNPNYASPNFSN